MQGDRTALHCAAERGHTLAVRALLRTHCASLQDKDKVRGCTVTALTALPSVLPACLQNGNTPRDLAKRGGNAEVVRLLDDHQTVGCYPGARRGGRP